MARKKRSKRRRNPKAPKHALEPAEWRYVICPASGVMHLGPVAARVRWGQGEGRAYADCPGCKLRVFFPAEWGAEHGYTLEQVQQLAPGVLVL